MGKRSHQVSWTVGDDKSTNRLLKEGSRMEPEITSTQAGEPSGGGRSTSFGRATKVPVEDQKQHPNKISSDKMTHKDVFLGMSTKKGT
jgi:hypothetical protein